MNKTLGKEIIKFFSAIYLAYFVFGPSFSLAQNNNPSTSWSSITGITWDCQIEHGLPDTEAGNCTFQDVILAIQRLVKWATEFALGFSVVVLAYAGYKYMISGDNASKRKDANKMIYNVVIGIIIVLAAWLIVTLITGALLQPGYSTWLG